METFNIYEAKAQLSELVRRALAGEHIVIAKAGTPLVKLAPYQKPRPRQGGQWKGRIWIADDFDAPLQDMDAEIYGEPNSD